MEYFLKHLSKRITAAAANAVKQDDSIKSSRDERTAFPPPSAFFPMIALPLQQNKISYSKLNPKSVKNVNQDIEALK